MDTRVSDYADACRTARQGNQPDPVTFAHQVIGAQPPPRNLAGQLLPLAICTPPINLNIGIDPEPYRVDVVANILCQIELALQNAGASARIDDPATVDLVLLP